MYIILFLAILITFVSLAASINMGVRTEIKENPFRKDEFSYVMLLFGLCSLLWVGFIVMKG